MKKQFKSILYFISLVLWMYSVTSCKSDEALVQVTPEAKTFLDFYGSNYESITTKSISPTSKTRSGAQIDESSTTLYVNYPADTEDAIKDLCNLVSSAQDISALHRLTAAEFSTTNTENTKYSINISESEVKKTLSPLVEQSKKYLYSKGMTEEDIQQMLKEEGAGEDQLVPLVLVLMNHEYSEQKIAKLKKEKSEFKVSNLFATSCMASTLNASLDCALEAIGADVLASLAQSSASAWSAYIIKRVFKTVAKRVLGPIGVAIAVVDFAFCMHRHGYTCIYAIITPVEIKYKGIINKTAVVND